MTDPTQFHPFTDVVDMSPEAIERRIKEEFQMNKLCAWLGEARPVKRDDRVAEASPAYSKKEARSDD